MLRFRNFVAILFFLSLSGCAGADREFANINAKNFGADWVVVQYKFDGTAFMCWQLRNVAITNEGGSDGIYWKDTASGHLVHISGWYNRVQVTSSDFQQAASLVGVENDLCGNGKYPTK